MFQNYKIEVYSSVNEASCVKEFVIKNHYLKTSLPRGCSKWFVLFVDNEIYGVAAFGIPAGRNCTTKYGAGTLELRRFVLTPGRKDNTGSWFLSKCLKELKMHNILSYSDPTHNHTGGLYKAANFHYLGKQRAGSTRVKIGNILMFGQSSRAKKVKEKVHVYLQKKDIWLYPKRIGEKVDLSKLTRKLQIMNTVACLDLQTGVIYKSISAASKSTGLNTRTISFHLSRKIKKVRFKKYEVDKQTV